MGCKVWPNKRKTCFIGWVSTVILSSKSGIQGKVVLPLGSLGGISSCYQESGRRRKGCETWHCISKNMRVIIMPMETLLWWHWVQNMPVKSQELDFGSDKGVSDCRLGRRIARLGYYWTSTTLTDTLAWPPRSRVPDPHLRWCRLYILRVLRVQKEESRKRG